MSKRFSDAARLGVPIFDADAHVNEPPELWQERVPAHLRERAPRLEHSERGDIWIFDGGAEKWPVGLTATAGLSPFDIRPMGMTYERMRPGSFDTKARLADMDADGIVAQVLYPSVTLKGARIYSGDRELQLACVRAYNEWIHEFCTGSGGRLVPQVIFPTTGIEDAVAELEWARERGVPGGILSSFPNGSLDPTPEDDPFWARVQEADFPVAVHIGSFLRGEVTARKRGWNSLSFLAAAGLTKAGGQTLPVVCDLLFSGIWSRFPRLKVVLVEANIGWIPTLLEQCDDMFLRYRWFTGAAEAMRETPSEIFHRHFYATFMVDTVGMDLRHRLNLDHVMWSTDYPHSGTDWPDSRVTLERVFRGLPLEEVQRMVHGNCRALYGIELSSRSAG